MDASRHESASSEERVAIGAVLDGLSVHPLEPGEMAREAFVLLKIEDAEGDTYWAYRTTRKPNREELLGALVVHADILRRELVKEWGEGE